MDINVVGLILTIAIMLGALYVNNRFNPDATIKTILKFVIVGIGLWILWLCLGIRNQTLHVG
jgi:ABC-type uncharacterized transport system permease subunit